jgi:hypothetical protein
MNGIKNRIEDALILWEKGRWEGAFLCVLIAVAATAYKRYPKEKDRDAFEKLICDSLKGVLAIEYRGECRPIEQIFYKWLRCKIVHEGGIPVDIQFMEEKQMGTMSFRAGGAPDYVLKIGIGWFFHLVSIVTQASENINEFSKDVPLKKE